MFRRLILLVLLCVALPGCTIWKERPPKTFSDVTGGENLERVFWQEVKAQHWNEVEKRLASNYISVMPTGQLDRAATLNHLKQLQLQAYSLGEFQTELNGNTYVVAYTATMSGTSNGQPLSNAPVRMMTVWQQQKAGWVALAHAVVGPEGK